MSPIPWALNAELYPMRVRATCVALGTTANWVTNFIVAATFLSLQTAVGSPAAFWLYGSVALLGAVWLYITMPETAGRSLEQIERLFHGYGNFPADAAAPSVQRT
jgi:MFS transporter, SP family, solute carrier family 2 (myo-inositol transporter), member 13